MRNPTSNDKPATTEGTGPRVYDTATPAPAKQLGPGVYDAPSRAGGLLVRLASALFHRARPLNGNPEHNRDGQVHRLERPDGTVLQVESYGSDDAPPFIPTHGWGTNSTEWHYLKRQLSTRFRVSVWDLPRVGLSTRPHTRDYSLDAFAEHLDAVLRFAGKPAILLGHSIGGITILTFCRRFPEALGTRVAGLALVHTTGVANELAGLSERPSRARVRP